jgi:SAM-dependent methyltransferase
MLDWYGDWQNRDHVRHFDFRSSLDDRNILRNYESLNDVRLLAERIDRTRELRLLEIGCATGEFMRYLRLRFPSIRYYGVDISRPAIERAMEKYPDGRFFCISRDEEIRTLPGRIGLSGPPQIVYAKDVAQHQVRPFAFVSDLVALASETVIIRCRTRDVGKTELDPERSCQYHYDGWMPYIVMNLRELLDHIIGLAPHCELAVYRNHMVLGGYHGRYLPKDCYLRETGTAETALAVFLRTDRPGHVSIADRLDQNPRYTLDHLVRAGVRKALSLIR